MENGTTNDGHTQLMAYAQGLHPNVEMAPCDLQPGGRYQLPPAFELHIDVAHDEWVRLFGPNDASIRVKTLVQYGGRYLIRGLDLLRALAEVCRVGEPTWERSLETQALYWRGLLATAAPFTIPARAPMTRAEMECHINTCDQCKPVAAAYGLAVDSGASITNDAHVKAMIERAHADSAGAVAYYNTIADGRNSLFTTAVTPAKPKRTTQPLAVTQEA
jgi:hypothetical protein